MLAADVPVFSRYEASARQWTDAGRACRAYDARHGTTSRLRARFADTDYQTTVVADTPCLDHVAMTTTWTNTRRAPDRLIPTAAVDVPNRTSRDIRMRKWVDAGRTCRTYDLAHGTTSILVFVPSSGADGEALVADTPCLDGVAVLTEQTSRSVAEQLNDAGLCTSIEPVTGVSAQRLETTFGFSHAWACSKSAQTDDGELPTQTITWVADSVHEKAQALKRVDATYRKVCASRDGVKPLYLVEGPNWLATIDFAVQLQPALSVLGGQAVTKNCP
jgi:hypothetical protein